MEGEAVDDLNLPRLITIAEFRSNYLHLKDRTTAGIIAYSRFRLPRAARTRKVGSSSTMGSLSLS